VVKEIEDFVTPENVDPILAGPFDYVIDAIDQVRTKAAMIAWSKRLRVALITAGGAGGQIDPTRIQIADLALTIQDPLLARLRSLLRKDYGFTREAKKKFGIAAVSSRRSATLSGSRHDCEQRPCSVTGLNCAGFGSSVCVTATFGLLAAGEVLRVLASTAVGAPDQGRAHG
jgi:tRNA A37 threonylcarbamoyladenosine dehydratase